MEIEQEHINCLPTKLPYEVLEQITNGFDKERELGGGTFGVVYEGLHENGQHIAVKVLQNSCPTVFDDNQFKNEFSNLAMLKHPNVVQLLGYCDEEREEEVNYMGKKVTAYRIHKALCLEYVNMGSLQKYISGEYPRHNWHTTYKIIKGICEGLLYLHEAFTDPILHLDLKPDNILLDENMVPKIADFGLSRLFCGQTCCATTSSVGTIGYLPPEYINDRLISKEFDIFSLGVIIAKTMVGRLGYSKIADVGSQNFIKHVSDIWWNNLQRTKSPSLLQVWFHQVTTCIKIALKYLKWNQLERPTALQIVKILNETERLITGQALGIQQFHCGECVLPFKRIIASWTSSVAFF